VNASRSTPAPFRTQATPAYTQSKAISHRPLYGTVRKYGETTGTNGTSRLPWSRVGNAAKRFSSPREAFRPDCQGGCRGFKSLRPLCLQRLGPTHVQPRWPPRAGHRM